MFATASSSPKVFLRLGSVSLTLPIGTFVTIHLSQQSHQTRSQIGVIQILDEGDSEQLSDRYSKIMKWHRSGGFLG